MKKSIPNEILLPEVARLIKEGHTVTITVRGNSMNPFLVDRRDRVTLGDFTTEQLQPGVMTEAMRKDKRYTADGKVWKLYSYWWMKLNPARRWLLALFRRI